MLNRSYAKIKSGGAAIDYAPAVPVVNGSYCVAPTAADYAAAAGGPFYPLANNPPPSDPPQGYHYEPTGWELRPDSSAPSGVYRVYVEVQDPPPPPREFSKLKVVAALTDAGVWQQVKTYIEQNGLYDLYLAAQDFREDNPYFSQALAALQTALGWTDAQVEELLAKCVKEGA